LNTHTHNSHNNTYYRRNRLSHLLCQGRFGELSCHTIPSCLLRNSSVFFYSPYPCMTSVPPYRTRVRTSVWIPPKFVPASSSGPRPSISRPWYPSPGCPRCRTNSCQVAQVSGVCSWLLGPCTFPPSPSTFFTDFAPFCGSVPNVDRLQPADQGLFVVVASSHMHSMHFPTSWTKSGIAQSLQSTAMPFRKSTATLAQTLKRMSAIS
jgi:hypothetical protein